jgi:hypothetical protein
MMGIKVTNAADALLDEEEDRVTGLNIIFQHLQVNETIITIS